MATTPAPKSVLIDHKYTKFEPSTDQQIFIDTYGRKDGRDCERLKCAIKLAFTLNSSWRKAFFDILESEKPNP